MGGGCGTPNHLVIPPALNQAPVVPAHNVVPGAPQQQGGAPALPGGEPPQQPGVPEVNPAAQSQPVM